MLLGSGKVSLLAKIESWEIGFFSSLLQALLSGGPREYNVVASSSGGVDLLLVRHPSAVFILFFVKLRRIQLKKEFGTDSPGKVAHSAELDYDSVLIVFLLEILRQFRVSTLCIYYGTG